MVIDGNKIKHMWYLKNTCEYFNYVNENSSQICKINVSDETKFSVEILWGKNDEFISTVIKMEFKLTKNCF